METAMKTDYSLLFSVWPWIGLGAAAVLLVLAAGTSVLRADLRLPRWRDPTWLAWLAAVAYMLHNLEEYGISAAGRVLHFPEAMTEMGFTHFSEAGYLATNLSLVWVVGPLLAHLSRRYPALAGALSGFALVNSFLHLAQAVRLGYNPGTLTSILVFLPLGLWTAVTVFGRDGARYSWPVYARLLSVSVLGHAVLLGTVLITATVDLPPVAQALLMTADATLCLWLWLLVARRAEQRVQSH